MDTWTMSLDKQLFKTILINTRPKNDKRTTIEA